MILDCLDRPLIQINHVLLSDQVILINLVVLGNLVNLEHQLDRVHQVRQVLLLLQVGLVDQDHRVQLVHQGVLRVLLDLAVLVLRLDLYKFICEMTVGIKM